MPMWLTGSRRASGPRTGRGLDGTRGLDGPRAARKAWRPPRGSSGLGRASGPRGPSGLGRQPRGPGRLNGPRRLSAPGRVLGPKELSRRGRVRGPRCSRGSSGSSCAVRVVRSVRSVRTTRRVPTCGRRSGGGSAGGGARPLRVRVPVGAAVDAVGPGPGSRGGRSPGGRGCSWSWGEPCSGSDGAGPASSFAENGTGAEPAREEPSVPSSLRPPPLRGVPAEPGRRRGNRRGTDRNPLVEPLR